MKHQHVYLQGIITSFPAFVPDNDTVASTPLGFFAYNDQMVGGMEHGTRYGRWGVDALPSGTMAGPVVIFPHPDHDAGALVLAPFSNFMAQNVFYDNRSRGVMFGLLGSATSVPAGTCMSVAAFLDRTPTAAVLG